jgi:L-fucose mutarotase
MLKGIDPLLGPDFLAALRAMGHGDEIAIVDANYPAAANARHLIRCDGHDLDRVLQAVLSVLPLDDFDGAPAHTMRPVDQETYPVLNVIAALLEIEGAPPAQPLDRQTFYERSRACQVIIATGERGLYGNVILRKGVVRAELSSKGNQTP